MRIQIINVSDKLSRGTRVQFTALHGSAKGSWIGGSPYPSSYYDVELEIDEEFTIDRNMVKVLSHDFMISTENDHVVLQGRIESADADGVCTLRIGDSLVLLDVTGELPRVGDFVQVICSDILLFDTNI